MREFRNVVTAIGDAAGARLKSGTVWSEAEGDAHVPPAFSAHLLLDGAEYVVSLVPTRGFYPGQLSQDLEGLASASEGKAE